VAVQIKAGVVRLHEQGVFYSLKRKRGRNQRRGFDEIRFGIMNSEG